MARLTISFTLVFLSTCLKYVSITVIFPERSFCQPVSGWGSLLQAIAISVSAHACINSVNYQKLGERRATFVSVNSIYDIKWGQQVNNVVQQGHTEWHCAKCTHALAFIFMSSMCSYPSLYTPWACVHNLSPTWKRCTLVASMNTTRETLTEYFLWKYIFLKIYWP